MLPSTFFEEKYDNATLARKFHAKKEMAEFWQQVVAQRTQEILDEENPEFSDRAAKLQDFQDKLISGAAFPTGLEIMKFARLFEQEFQLRLMSPTMLKAMCNMLGLPASGGWRAHQEVILRHHITSLRREDRDYLWEGVEQLSRSELIEACKKRAIRFHAVSEDKMRRDLARWLELSSNRKIPTALLLWIQTFYLSRAAEIGGSLTDPSEFHIQVPDVDEEQEGKDDAREAFHNLAVRQKATLDSARKKLEDLETEIVQVIEQPQAVNAGTEDSRSSDDAVEEANLEALEQEQEKKKRILDRVEELKKALRLHKNIAERQRELLMHQLEFMIHMRDNTPTQHQDAGRILLDQRIRLVEMMSSFAKDTEEIEKLFEEASHVSEDIADN